MSNVWQQTVRRVVRPVVITAAFAAMASPSAFAADCGKVIREEAIRECLSAELSVADGELNATYGKLRGGMDKETLDLLTKAQKLWISLRDADCELEAEAYKGGTAYQAIYLQCQINKTKQRTSEFKKSTYWPRK
jgi:uncharacterized protein YecT (DUF1311 family)